MSTVPGWDAELPRDDNVHALRAPIVASWRRSSACRVPREKRAELPYDGDFDGDSRLIRAAEPVLDRLAATLADTTTSLILADCEARIVSRWVGGHSLFNALDRADAAPGFVFAEEFAGTNGLGTALEEASMVSVVGDEHYSDFLRHLACVGVPIRHPLTRRVEGILDMTTLASEHNDLMGALLIEAVAHIETRMSQMSPLHERVLLEEFTRISRRYPGAVLGLSHGMAITNSSAAERVTAADQLLLWDFARDLAVSGADSGWIELSRGLSKVSCTPVITGTRAPLGVVLRITFAGPGTRTSAVGTVSGPRSSGKDSEVLPPSPAGRSAQWQRLLSRLGELAAVTSPVMITGEEGTGKSHLVRHLHAVAHGGREAPRLLVLNASAVSQDEVLALFDETREGLRDGLWVLVRRVEGLPPSGLAALRHLLADSRSGCEEHLPGRLIVTERTSDERLSGEGPLVADSLWVPPLSQRTSDIPDLVRALLAELSGTAGPGCSMPALQTLIRCPWPGNVADLKEALASALRMSCGDEIQVHHLPVWVLKRSTQRPLSKLRRSERTVIIDTLASVGHNRTEAARVLGIGRATLYRRMRVLGIPLEHTLS